MVRKGAIIDKLQSMFYSGVLAANVSSLINVAFIESLPLEFFYLEQLAAVFGGLPVYYLGVYGFGSSFTRNPEDR